MREINSLNKVMLIGNLGGDPEMRYLPQQERKVARFNIATKERLFNPNTRESSDRTEWHRVVVWGKLAEFCEKYLNKGRQILVEGKLRTRDWQDKEGNKRRTTEVEAINIVLLGRREGSSATSTDTTDLDEAHGRGAGRGAAAPAQAGDEDSAPFDDAGGGGDDDIPF
ncbi:MAG TPA: single-stranded DNA-binding protein [Candidatus Aminicenantes bacterium]|nr:single-stranded DNA-binding protein [Candidatus Aminicenantes bacterium]